MILIRGLPGSGKTTFAKNNFPNHVLVEADQFFELEKLGYCFDPSLLKHAHAWAFYKAKTYHENKIPVVVANTFSQNWEIAPYLEFTSLKIYKMNTLWESIHDVPQSAIEKMKNRWEDIEGEIVIDTYHIK